MCRHAVMMKNNTNFFQKSTIQKNIDGVYNIIYTYTRTVLCVCVYVLFLCVFGGENAKNQFALLIINHREQTGGEGTVRDEKYSIYIPNAQPLPPPPPPPRQYNIAT